MLLLSFYGQIAIILFCSLLFCSRSVPTMSNSEETSSSAKREGQLVAVPGHRL